MSEVKRYTPSMRVGHMVKDKDGLWNRSQDFDRVTAERDALQALLTAADERADEREGLLRDVSESVAGRHGTFARIPADWFDRRDAALKPAEVAKCERCGCSTVETCDDLGCGYLGAGNGAPE